MDGAGAVCRLSGRRGRAGGARPRPTRRARLQSRGCGPAIGRWPPRACASGGGAPGAAASAAAGGLGSNGVHPHQSARQRLGIPVSWAAAPDTAGPGRSASIPCGEHRPGHPAANHSRFPADPFNIPSNSGDSGMVSDISTTYGGGGGRGGVARRIFSPENSRVGASRAAGQAAPGNAKSAVSVAFGPANVQSATSGRDKPSQAPAAREVSGPQGQLGRCVRRCSSWPA